MKLTRPVTVKRGEPANFFHDGIETCNMLTHIFHLQSGKQLKVVKCQPNVITAEGFDAGPEINIPAGTKMYLFYNG